MTFAPNWKLPRLPKLDLESMQGRMSAIAIKTMMLVVQMSVSKSRGSNFSIVLQLELQV